MAVFVDLEDEDVEPPQDVHQPHPLIWNPAGIEGVKAVVISATAEAARGDDNGSTSNSIVATAGHRLLVHPLEHREEAHGLGVRENPNRNSLTQALGCYPIIASVAANIDLNTLDNLSRTCRQIREGLLQYRKVLLASTLHCSNDHLPVDPEETLRYRAAASNWFYMEDAGRSRGTAKAGQCARDLVKECRRCGTVVCRNCAIKPPAPIVLRDRHRRLCVSCARAPLGLLVKPRLGPEFSLASSDELDRAICKCATDGVWLCQPCGKTIRNNDDVYKSVWRWRGQYADSLSGLGVGIGDGDRGVECGRETECCAGREREQETDCDAADAREAEISSSSSTSSSLFGPWSSTSSNGSSDYIGFESNGINSGSTATATTGNGGGIGRRTPSPTLLQGPGYERHEIEGIGGVVKRKLVRMVKIGACVPEWDDERAAGDIMGREVRGQVRSWCGWCWRVIPAKKDYEKRD
ncbi:hypothetical protein B0H63DRAFT_229184 [Podospora didyma]|uniref:Sulfate transporter protein n=1 Tax=Podospora didyma TaxID=330526 RepID=A0AAE0KKG6_9PEZI|nr:hypothetical protein B0H63DRAFT_229184 [Podospora didyma]